jgi:hypothetical protein
MKAFAGLVFEVYVFLIVVSGQLQAPVVLAPRKHPQCSLNRKLGEPQNRFRRLVQERNILLLPGIQSRFLLYPTHIDQIRCLGK